MRSFVLILCSICLALGCAAETDDVAGPTFSPLDPEPHEGTPGGAAGWSSEGDPPVAGAGGVSGAPATPPTPTTSCGQNGDACCAEGPACAQNPEKSRCCTDCGGFPGFKCNCGEDWVADGSCKVCCVVCENGFVSTPQLVPSGTTCDAVANDLCAKKGGASSNKSGWKASCE